jgi:hypothetical protein
MILKQSQLELRTGERILSIHGEPVCDQAESGLVEAAKKRMIISIPDPEVTVALVNHRGRVRKVLLGLKQVLIKGGNFGIPNGLIIDSKSPCNGWIVHNANKGSALLVLARPPALEFNQQLRGQFEEFFPEACPAQGIGHATYDNEKWEAVRRSLRRNQGMSMEEFSTKREYM